MEDVQPPLPPEDPPPLQDEERRDDNEVPEFDVSSELIRGPITRNWVDTM